jgi:hypothetical protein
MGNIYLNKKLLEAELKKHKLMCEYSFYVGEDDDYDKDANNLILGEDGDEENQEDNGFGDTNNNNPNPNNDNNNDPNGGNGDEMGNQPPMEPGMGEEPGMEPEMGMEPEGDAPIAPEEPIAPAEDEVELDVTQLVQGTEDAKASADMATQKMEDLLMKFGELESQLANMNSISSKIEDLEHQIEKRNPTPEEKLEMRSFDSYPYNLKLTDYWAEKEGAYNVLDNGEEKNKEYVLTQDDINSEYNESSVKNMFNDYEEEEF